MSNYTFPSIHSFPPFYTLQPTLATRAKQLQLWGEILLQYCIATRTSAIHLATNSKDAAAVFSNDKIRRRLDRESIQAVIEELIKQGHAGWDSPAKDQCLIFWRKPEEWAAIIHKWAFDSGATNSICTIYELLHGDDTVGLDFHDLDERTMVRALEALAKSGKAQIFVGATDSEMGVKFF
ncbi:vacuolar protein sorting 25 [Powellomyces hirtus]|nr:vacuolar protein sorting 25 [Powellomyces hirtus]